MDSIQEAIARAETVLPGVPSPDGEQDPRWQAIIDVAEFIESDPEEVWEFAVKWGCHCDEDLQAAIGCCVLEHLIEHDIDLFLSRSVEIARRDDYFRRTFLYCWPMGDKNDARLQAAQSEFSR